MAISPPSASLCFIKIIVSADRDDSARALGARRTPPPSSENS